MSNAGEKAIEFQCPQCARRLKAGAQAAGKRLKCPGCGQPLTVPTAGLNPPPGAIPSAAQNTDSKPVSKAAAGLPQSTSLASGVDVGAPESAAMESAALAARPAENKSRSEGSKSAGIAAPSFDADDEFRLEPISNSRSPEAPKSPPRAVSIFDDDLPELAELEAPRPRADLGAMFGMEGLDTPDAVGGAKRLSSKPAPSAEAKPPQSSKSNARSPTGGAGSAKARADGATSASGKEVTKKSPLSDLAQQQYRVACPSCGTPQYVTMAIKGRTIRCPDCFLEFKIPPPPADWKPSDKPAHTNWGTGLAEQPAAEKQRDAARSRANADDYMRKAEQELADEDIDSLYEGDFDTASFVQRTFGFAFDSASLSQAGLYSVLFAILFAAAQWGKLKMEDGDNGIVLVIGIALPLCLIILIFPMFAAAMTMLESIANGERKVREWPGFNFYDHIGELILFATALVASAIPGFLLGGFIGRSGGMAWMVILATMSSTFFTFPIILLSMLDNESMFNPVSPDVLGSLRRGSEAWGTYYFKTFVAFSFVFVSWCILLGFGPDPLLTGMAGGLIPWLIFFTCQQLGVLAMDISDQLSLHLSMNQPEKADDTSERETL